MKKRLLLHICCAPDGVYIPETLSDEFEVICYFYNPNIFPKEEYEKRKREMERVAEAKGYELVVGDYNYEDFVKSAEKLYYLPEKSARCDFCLRMRMEESARKAKELNCQVFATVLTVSPHKDFEKINIIGKEVGEKYGVEYMPSNFKKNDGFKKSVEEGKKLNLYRQDYCGCESSLVYRKMFKDAESGDVVFLFYGDKVGIFDLDSVKKHIERNNLKTGFVFYKHKPTENVLKYAYELRIFLEPYDNLEWRKRIFEKKGKKVEVIKLSDIANRDIFLDPC
ncbi:conserved hypothetical protein [Thermotomaculum hydrothermale]|uniref:Epoxyqueuosine reductase QueH n=1 Tax=Thermotomaculum hydrothermale TaxID=981385 RepID=A0A7R6PRZ5_9BACT|nr:epoxyqueuosine reductase QueH [Thermotomaculum hydrothermale]BBB33251.1 conserved hypothetical protein [Thermotomaculum hydrothermale]